MDSSNRTPLYLLTGLLTTLMLGIAWTAWALNLTGDINIYDIFPVLGLTAFILMGMHYISGSLKRLYGLAGDTATLRRYFAVTSYVVLILILLHPGLLYFGLWQDGFGLPPFSSWQVYPQTAAKVGLIMGSVALTAFLLFELRHWFREKSWWKYIEYASIVGMILIFVHSLTLGGDLMNGWFRLVWIIFGWAVAFAIVYNYRFDHNKNKEEL